MRYALRDRLATATAIGSLLLAATPTVLATDYFVRSDGNDGNTGRNNTSSGAFASIARCLQAVGPGDRCRVQPGSYEEQGLTLPAGSLDANDIATCSCTEGSTSLSCSGDVSTSVSAGQWVRCDVGDTGFHWTRVSSVSGSTISLDEGYRGPSASSSPLDVADMVELRGDGSSASDTIVTQWSLEPAGLSWSKVSGLECTYRYEKASVSQADWRSPVALREVVPWGLWDLHDDNVNGRDPYLWIENAGTCPCASSTVQEHVDRVPGSWGEDSTYVYAQTWDCDDPDNAVMEAGNQSSGAIIKSKSPFSVVSNLTVQASAYNSHSSNDLYHLSFELGASNSLYRDLVAESGRIWFNPNSGSYNFRFEDVRALNAFRSTSGSFGVHFYNMEIRGGHPNQFSADSLSGISPTQRVVFDRLFMHRGWTHHRTADAGCNQQPNYDCDAKVFVSPYRATHGMYLGSLSANRRIDHITIQNSVIELTFDGIGIFTGGGADDLLIRNNTFGFAGDHSQEFLWLGNNAGGDWSAKVYNNLFLFLEGTGVLQGGLRHNGPGSVEANNNLYLYAGRSQSGSPRIWNDGESLPVVINTYGQERDSIVVCKSGCSGSPGTHYNDGSDPRLVDWRTDDGDRTDYTPLSDFRGIGRALSSQCPAEDFYGRSRGAGACDIGAIEFEEGGGSDPTPPGNVGNNRRTDVK